MRNTGHADNSAQLAVQRQRDIDPWLHSSGTVSQADPDDAVAADRLGAAFVAGTDSRGIGRSNDDSVRIHDVHVAVDGWSDRVDDLLRQRAGQPGLLLLIHDFILAAGFNAYADAQNNYERS